MARILVGPVLRYAGTDCATVWVETDVACEVEILGHRERTWEVSGHHYALLVLRGLTPGTSTPYAVALDGEPAWPDPRYDQPQSRIRTRPEHGTADPDPVRLAYGSCRYGRAAVKLADRHFDQDSLGCYSRLLARSPESEWPEAVIMLGDQVYADETSEATQRRIRARRDITQGAQDQLADFEEYTWLYLESWTDPEVRWIMSTIPSCMIFDDHDIRDDWNTSHAWRVDMQATDWWQERVVGGLSSYWVYQHLGNLTPSELDADELFQQVRTSGADNEPALREFATRADAEADGEKGTRWSYVRDFGRTRLVMIDSRCGRILAEGRRSMVSESEFAWITEQVAGDFDHLLIGTSLPWLLAPALHDLESWNEALADGARGPRRARLAEKLRRAADLEHWAAFRRSFDALGDLIESVARGDHGPAPATVCVLSGDVHHAYTAAVSFEGPATSKVYQLTCSPLHNYVPAYMKLTFRMAWSSAAARLTRRALRLYRLVTPARVQWARLSGPFFSNEIGVLDLDGRRARGRLRRSAPMGDDRELIDVDDRVLA